MNKRGQSIIEYVLIAVLVILGIVYMGPYVLRSVGAHFKLWDDTARDSFSETITQAPVNAVPDLPLNCHCTTIRGACGGSIANGTSQCGPGQRETDYNCTPQGCNGSGTGTKLSDGAQLTFSCQFDPTCCTEYYKQGCGSLPLTPAAASGDTASAPAGIPVSNVDPSGNPNGLPASNCVTYPLNNGNVAPNCYYGQYLWATECPSTTSTSSIVCCPVTDNSCQPVCQGLTAAVSTSTSVATPVNGVQLCPNSPSSISNGLIQTTQLTYVGADNTLDCPSGNPNCTICDANKISPPTSLTACQVYCGQGYLLNQAGTACTNTFTVAPIMDGRLSVSACTSETGTCTCVDDNNGGGNHVTINTCSFNMCAATNSTLTVSDPPFTDLSSPEIPPYCGNSSETPPYSSGNPGEECSINFTYSPSSSSTTPPGGSNNTPNG